MGVSEGSHSRKKQSQEDKHKRDIRFILKKLGISENESVARNWLGLAGRGNECSLHRRTHRQDLKEPRPLDEEFKDFWNDMEQILDILLDKFQASFLKTEQVIEELLAKPIPNESDLNRLRNKVPNNLVSYRHFFGQLNNPAWLKPLTKHGFFKNPPSFLINEEGGVVSEPIWPQSQYLARLASKEPETVAEIIREIPDTDNRLVHADLTEAACKMPPELAAKWAVQEAEWIKKQEDLYFPLPGEFCKLISHLAKGKQTDAAIKLAESLLEILPDPKGDKPRELKMKEDSLYFGPHPRVRFDHWEYEKLLKENIPDLVSAAKGKALRLLCDLLRSAVTLSMRESERGKPTDYSYIWLRSIETAGRGRYPAGLRELLVAAVRFTAERLLDEGDKVVLEIVESYQLKLFKRIGLHLRRRWPDVDPAGTAEIVKSRDVLWDDHLREEFELLVQDLFHRLAKEAQETYLDFVDKGPDTDGWIRYMTERNGTEPSRGEIDRFVRRVQFEALWPVRTHLVSDWKRKFEEFKSEFGDLPDPGQPVEEEGVQVGPTSPKSHAELKEMKVEDVIKELKRWEPRKGVEEPSPKGFGRQLEVDIESRPGAYAERAEDFKEIEPTYVRAIFSGLRDAVKKGEEFDWVPVIELAKWVLLQPKEIPGRSEDDWHSDPNWIWTRKAIADLFGEGFQPGSTELPFPRREDAWGLLAELTKDPEPTTDYEERHGGETLDPFTLSINTVRGVAMHSVMAYALWVRRDIEKQEDREERIKSGFDEMPEVREVLDAHLDPNNDPALSIRAVYGKWFPWLVLLDHGWAEKNVKRVFPSDNAHQKLRDAAWKAYITFCDPYDNVFALLKDEYRRAIDMMGSDRREQSLISDPEERLSRHLMAFYWRGKISLESDDGLLEDFYSKAPDEVRGAAFRFVGDFLRNYKSMLKPGTKERLEKLWEHRVARAEADGKESFRGELGAFGKWFISGVFDADWAFDQLKRALRMGGEMEGHHVAEHLISFAATRPIDAVESLGLLIQSEKRGWGPTAFRDAAWKILETAMKSADNQAQNKAVDLVNRLGALGFREYGDLLPDKNP